jgi:hypothetical protein
MAGSWRRRCDAHAKHKEAHAAGDWRTAFRRCRKWAVPGKTRCYLHGGKSTGPRTPEGKAASLAARLEGRRRRIAQLALEGKKINTGHNGGRPRKDGQPMKRRIRTRQQILAALKALATPDLTPSQAAIVVSAAAERRIHEKGIAREIAERRTLLNLVFRGADANIRALAGRGPRDEDLIARAHEVALELQRRWRKRAPRPHDAHRIPPDSGPWDQGGRCEFTEGGEGAGVNPELTFDAAASGAPLEKSLAKRAGFRAHLDRREATKIDAGRRAGCPPSCLRFEARGGSEARRAIGIERSPGSVGCLGAKTDRPVSQRAAGRYGGEPPRKRLGARRRSSGGDRDARGAPRATPLESARIPARGIGGGIQNRPRAQGFCGL